MALESVMVLPIVATVVAGLVAVVSIITDVVVLHDGARIGARVATTTNSYREVVSAVNEALPELGYVAVTVYPQQRQAGSPVTVEVAARKSLGPFEHTLTARASALAEPAVDGSWPS